MATPTGAGTITTETAASDAVGAGACPESVRAEDDTRANVAARPA